MSNVVRCCDCNKVIDQNDKESYLTIHCVINGFSCRCLECDNVINSRTETVDMTRKNTSGFPMVYTKNNERKPFDYMSGLNTYMQESFGQLFGIILQLLDWHKGKKFEHQFKYDIVTFYNDIGYAADKLDQFTDMLDQIIEDNNNGIEIDKLYLHENGWYTIQKLMKFRENKAIKRRKNSYIMEGSPISPILYPLLAKKLPDLHIKNLVGVKL